MKNIIEQLENHLQATSDAQFLAEWAEIEALGLQGPDVHEYTMLLNQSFFVASSSEKISIEQVHSASVVHSAQAKTETDILENYQYAMAA